MIHYKLEEKKQDIHNFKAGLYQRLASPSTGKIHGCKHCFNEDSDCETSCRWTTFYFWQENADRQLEHLDLTLNAPLETKDSHTTSMHYWDSQLAGEQEQEEMLQRKLDREFAKWHQLDCFEIIEKWTKRASPSRLRAAYRDMTRAYRGRTALSSRTATCRAFNELWGQNKIAAINLVSMQHSEICNYGGYPTWQFSDEVEEEDQAHLSITDLQL